MPNLCSALLYLVPLGSYGWNNIFRVNFGSFIGLAKNTIQQSCHHRSCVKFSAEHESDVSETENQAVGELQGNKVLETREKSEFTLF